MFSQGLLVVWSRRETGFAAKFYDIFNAMKHTEKKDCPYFETVRENFVILLFGSLYSLWLHFWLLVSKQCYYLLKAVDAQEQKKFAVKMGYLKQYSNWNGALAVDISTLSAAVMNMPGNSVGNWWFVFVF